MYGCKREYLRVIINPLRKKIEDDPAHPAYILTENHIGTAFAETSDRAPLVINNYWETPAAHLCVIPAHALGSSAKTENDQRDPSREATELF
jgi:hypothetical protein